MKLATGPATPMSMRCQRGWAVKEPGSSAAFSRTRCPSIDRGFAGHLDVAAEGQQADLVIGVAALDAEKARPEADGKCLDADAAELGDGKMAKFVDHHHHANQDNESDGGNDKFVKILHRIKRYS